jgi:hypothetical protein
MFQQLNMLPPPGEGYVLKGQLESANSNQMDN